MASALAATPVFNRKDSRIAGAGTADPSTTKFALALEDLVEERGGPLPGELCRLGVVARGAGIVVEGVVHIGIDISRELDTGLLQRRLVARLGRVHPLVEAGIMQHHPRLDL